MLHTMKLTPVDEKNGQREHSFWLCGKCEPKQLGGPPPVSPAILLMLGHQLATDLTSDSKLKLAWIKESLNQVKPRDPSVAGATAPVLSMVREKLSNDAVLDALESNGLAPDVAMVERMATKLLAAA